MRMTIDIPDGLFRQVKARAAARGLKLREYVAEALEQSLYERRSGSETRGAEAAHAQELLGLSPECSLPLISGETGVEMASISERRIDEILERDYLEERLRRR